MPIKEVNAATVPQPPTGLGSVAVSPTKIVLSWNAPTDNGNSSVTGYMIEYKIVPNSYSILVTNTGNVTTYTHSPVTTGKVYIYRVSAMNAIGTSAPSGETVASPTSTSGQTVNAPPNPPTGLTATAVSSTKINLSWNAPTSNGSPAVTGYKIERKVSSGTYSVLVTNTGNTTTAYSNTGLTTNISYTYQVSAINSVGTSSPSNEASAMPTPTSAPPATKPSAPTGLTASAMSETQIKLFWQPPNNGGSPITGYKIEYKNGTNTYFVLSSNVGNVTTYIHNGLKTGSTYTYRVSALNSMGTSSTSNEASATPTKTLTPTGLIATAISPTSIALSWNAPTETYGQTITGYRIDQKLSSGVFQTMVDSSATQVTSYNVTGLKTGTTYTYVVAAVYSGGTSSNPSNEASTTPTNTSSGTPPTSTPPSTNPPPQTISVSNPPIGLTATAVSSTKINLSWAAPSNNGGSLVTGYKIERKVSQGPYFVLANTDSSTTYSDTGVIQGTTYTYRVSAINSIGTSNPSNEVSSTTFVETPPPQNSILNVGTVKVTNTAYNIRYVITGGNVLSSNIDPETFSLVVKIQTTSNGVLVLPLPRSLIDAKMPNDQNDVFYVLADQKPVTFNDDMAPTRTLSINFPYGTKEIVIYGTQVVPEFGSLALLALAVAIASLIFISTKNRFGKLIK